MQSHDTTKMFTHCAKIAENIRINEFQFCLIGHITEKCNFFKIFCETIEK